ncbi:MAG: alpha/beta hydrolase fold domain-containing protein [Planctomycetales bacterium]|nr:alpha/beta hydrolase fold domain-containing protein [Planctomycetales bacterium]
MLLTPQMSIYATVLLALLAPLGMAVPPGESLTYKSVEARDLKIYVTKPDNWQSGDSRPAIVFFHGGGWVGGQPGQFTEHAKYFASRGVVCFQVEYRLLNRNEQQPPTNCVQDAADALRWVREQSTKFGVNSSRIAAGGGSAGGHLAAYLGTIAEGASRCNAMLLFNPVYDNGPDGWGTARVGDRWPEFSPLHNLSSSSPPSIVFLGTEDSLIPVATAEEFQRKSMELNVLSELHTYAGQAHGFFNTNRDSGRWYYETVVAADRFLNRLGWIEGAPTLRRPIADNVVLITLDGLRSEEVFTGADKRLMIRELGVSAPEQLEKDFYREDAVQRRTALMPNLWRHIESGGWIAGDFERNSLVRVTNGKYFSYPGYNELLSGFADEGINSNAKNYNENTTVLEWLNQQPDLQGHVTAYCSWDVFPYIINDRRSGVPVNAGWSKLTVGQPGQLSVLNFVGENLFHEWDGVRYDAFTTAAALQAIEEDHPRVLYVSLGETDDWAHAGRYDRYLTTAHQNDLFIQTLWEKVQSLDNYRDRTAFIIATDHGRGDGREGWKNHSVVLPGSERIWLAAWGAGITSSGIDEGGNYEQAQVAATVAKVLGYDFTSSDEQIAAPLPIVGIHESSE